jgi:calcium-dependent protein kinase
MNFGKRFVDLKRLGSGTFGEVWSGYDSTRGGRVAIKRFKELGQPHLGINMLILREVSFLRQLQHPNIAGMLDVIVGKKIDQDSLLLVLELEDTDLYMYQKKMKGEMSLSMIQTIIKQIVDACSYLHSFHVIHR